MSTTDVIGTGTANVGRMYDYYLGGKDNFPVDREAADRFFNRSPEVAYMAIENRRVSGRMTEFLVEEMGIRQFIDLGSGLPTKGHTVHVLRDLGVADACRVVCVDEDPVVQSHAATAASSPMALIAADLRHPEKVLNHEAARELLDFSKPIALLAFAVLHFIPDEEKPGEIIGEYMAALARGSALAITHTTNECPDRVQAIRDVYGAANHGAYPRSMDAIEGLVLGAGLSLVDDGVVRVTDWRAPEDLRPPAALMWLAGGVACKN